MGPQTTARNLKSRKKSIHRTKLTFSIKQKKNQRSEIRKAVIETIDKPDSADSTIPSPNPVLENEDYVTTNLPNQQANNTETAHGLPFDKEDGAGSPLSSLANTTSSRPSTQQDTISSFTVDGVTIASKNDSQFIGIYDPATIFPFTNKPHEARLKTIAEESKQWEQLFDPQHTFGSFQHGIKTSEPKEYFYRGKWPLDIEDITGAVPRQSKKAIKKASIRSNGGIPQTSASSTTTESSVSQTTATEFLFPTVPSPTLPNLQHLELHIKTDLPDCHSLEDNHYSGSSSMGQIEILPCPSLSTFPTCINKNKNELLWKDRLQLLNSIQNLGFREELNGTTSNPFKESAATRLQRQLKRKAEKIKKEALVDSSTEEESNDEDERQEVTNVKKSDISQPVLLPPVALDPDTKDTESNSDRESTTNKLSKSSLVSLDDMWENISFTAPKTEKEHKVDDLEEQEEKEPELKKKNRPSFLYFAYGFIFPPLWIIGALYVPNASLKRTTASKLIDKKWKKYSRNAFLIFLLFVIATIVLLVALKPRLFGFRNSDEQKYQDEERIVFDVDHNGRSVLEISTF